MAWNIRTSRQVTPDLEILKFPAGIETAASIVLDASTVVADGDGRLVLKAGTLLSKNASNQYERFTAAVGQVIVGVLAHTVEFADNTSKSDQPAAMWFHTVVFRADRIVDFVTHGAAARTALPTCRFD